MDAETGVGRAGAGVGEPPDKVGERGAKVGEPGDNWIIIGVVRSAHGLDGTLKIESLSGETGHFQEIRELTLRKEGKSNRFFVSGIKSTGKFVLADLSSIGNVDQARLWVGAEVVVPRNLAAPVKDGEYYYADLVGCDVCVGGVSVGTVKSIIELPQCEALEVVTTSSKTSVVPFQDRFVGEVDLGARRIELLAGWLLE